MFSTREPVVPSTEPNIPKVVGNGHEETGCDTVALSEKDGAKTVRRWQDFQQRGSQGAGGDGMVKITKLLINVVIA